MADQTGSTKRVGSNILSHSTDEERRRSKLLSDKVTPIGGYLDSQTTPRSKSQIAEDLNSNSVANCLFSKAPIDFLESKQLSDLATITNHCMEALRTLFTETNTPVLSFRQLGSVHTLAIVLSDCPFVVNTINEALTALRITPSIFLHPILLHQGRRISVSYLEMPTLTGPEVTILGKYLERAFKDLVLTTNDFSAMLVRAETLSRIMLSPGLTSSFPESERREVSEFLRWLIDGNFIFLGHAEWRLQQGEIETSPSSALGIFKSSQSYKQELLSESRYDARVLLERADLNSTTRLNTESPIHRIVRMVNFSLQEFSSDGSTAAVHSFVGILTSKARAQESSGIPLIRRKLQRLIELEEVVHNSHDYKYLVDIIDSMPKDEALRLDIDSLREGVHTILGIQHKNDTRVSVRFDPARRGASVLIVMPRERFNSQVRQRIQAHIESVFGAANGSSEYHLNYSNKPQVRFYFYVPLASGEFPPLDLERLEQELADISRTWKDNLRERILETQPAQQHEELWLRYGDAFPADFQALQTVDDALHDIEEIQKLSSDSPISVAMSTPRESVQDQFWIIVYSRGSEITISRAVPVFENAGLEVLNERSAAIKHTHHVVHVHRFLVKSKSGTVISIGQFSKLVGPGLAELFQDRAENDTLNSLMANAALDIRRIALLRTYCCMLWQVNKMASREAILDTFATQPKAAARFWSMFETKFDPTSTLTRDARELKFKAALSQYRDDLREVTDITKDRVLRALASLLEHTIRTNFYLNTLNIAIKVQSRNVDVMPQPRPLYEIFVRSPIVEGVHLRSSKVSRGGLRWSERPEDFRSEVLGLVNTQTIKNVLIVPSGAKGGFIARQLPKEPDAVPAAVRAAYSEFIRSLLSIADNTIQGQVVHPKNVVIWDEPDPYFVVAADKGTATFSDVANQIAVDEYNYWLGDAFASGGSYGYDHKKYGITARGAWESVKRHFHDIGFDYNTTPFTVIGIGDMSGDVFGNGLIYSDKIKLLAAFDHRHIFVDPNPDPATSFAERKRLFELPKSKWTDYRKEAMSPGAAVFGRFDKEIRLTPEIRSAFAIAEDAPEIVSGEQLISLILRAPVDLLWSGGIGTYVKGRNQSHADVNDGTNDRVRVDADELRLKMVGEGGNLGFTQIARVEFSENGGMINTDAIDNSGGVDLSDHEVNIKILLAELVRTGKMTVPERNKLMLEIAPDVVEAVLTDNRMHALMLSLGVRRSRKNIGYFHSFIGAMHKMNYISRARLSLPDDDELNERALKKQGLFRPELAILLAAAKMWVKEVLLNSNLLENPLLNSYLLDYFPEKLQRLHRDAILAHPLSRNIIATTITNELINTTGITFVHRMCLKHSVAPIVVVRCMIAAENILKCNAVRASLWKFDTPQTASTFQKFWTDVSRAQRETASWLISYHAHGMSLDQVVELYQSRYKTLVQHAGEVFSGEERKLYEQRLNQYHEMGLDPFSGASLAIYPEIIRVLEMLWTSRKCRKNITLVATVFSQVLDTLNIGRILKLEPNIETSSKWESELVSHAYDEMRRSVSLITSKLLEKNIVYRDDIIRTLKESASFEQLFGNLAELKDVVPAASALAVLAKQLQAFELGAS